MTKTRKVSHRTRARRSNAPRIPSASLEQALVDLEKSLMGADLLEEAARQLAERAGQAQPDVREWTAAIKILEKTLTPHTHGGTSLSHYATTVQEALRDFPGVWPLSIYVPDSPGTPAPRDHRYSLEWISPAPTSTPGIPPSPVQVREVSKVTGYAGVANVVPWWSSSVGTKGWAQAGIGVLYRPRHAISRVTFVPEAQYRYEWIINTEERLPTPRMVNAALLRLVAQRVNPVSAMWETYVARHIELWRAWTGNWGGPFPFFVYQDNGGTGTYPAADPGLQLIASSADTLLLWFIVATYVQSDSGTTCLNKLEAAVPMMQIRDDQLA
jgi:hypothetical protein